MTYLEAANKSFSEARAAMRDKDYSQAARLFHHAKEMFWNYEKEQGDTRKLSEFATRWVRTATQKRDAALNA